MTHTVQYKGTYTDSSGTAEIVITNDFKTLACEIDGVKFAGMEFSDFVLIDEGNYTEEQLKRFSFFEGKVYNTGAIEKSLLDCLFTLTVPQIVIDKVNNVELRVDLHIIYAMDGIRPKPREIEFETIKLSLTIDEQKFDAIDPDYFELAFNQINKQFDNKYKFKNCYGCMFGDYHADGQRTFGSMLCYINQKEAYLKVKTKLDYLRLTDDYTEVQEIYCCDKYEMRKPDIGFRNDLLTLTRKSLPYAWDIS